MTSRPSTRAAVGMAGAVVLALAMHVLMLAGVGLSDMPHGTAAMGTAPQVAELAGPSGPTSMPEHDAGHGHMLAGCMALIAVLGLAVLVAAERRPSLAEQPPTMRCSPGRSRRARDITPPGPLVDRGVLLRV